MAKTTDDKRKLLTEMERIYADNPRVKELLTELKQAWEEIESIGELPAHSRIARSWGGSGFPYAPPLSKDGDAAYADRDDLANELHRDKGKLRALSEGHKALEGMLHEKEEQLAAKDAEIERLKGWLKQADSHAAGYVAELQVERGKVEKLREVLEDVAENFAVTCSLELRLMAKQVLDDIEGE